MLSPKFKILITAEVIRKKTVTSLEFKLKDGWFDYFLSGAILGCLVTLLAFVFGLQDSAPQISASTSLNLTVVSVVLALLFVLIFVSACSVKRRPP